MYGKLNEWVLRACVQVQRADDAAQHGRPCLVPGAPDLDVIPRHARDV
jgi:hypothetical protein